MYSGGILSISEVNALTPEQFEWLFGNVVEHYPNAAQHVASMRPFTSAKDLKKRFYDYLDKLDASEKETVLLKYPDLVGKFVEGAFLSADSQFGENSEFGTMSKDERQTLITYNDFYKEKFHIPFIIYARNSGVATILTSIQTRLQNTRDDELNIAFQEVIKICYSRINHLVWSDV